MIYDQIFDKEIPQLTNVIVVFRYVKRFLTYLSPALERGFFLHFSVTISKLKPAIRLVGFLVSTEASIPAISGAAACAPIPLITRAISKGTNSRIPSRNLGRAPTANTGASRRSTSSYTFIVCIRNLFNIMINMITSWG